MSAKTTDWPKYRKMLRALERRMHQEYLDNDLRREDPAKTTTNAVSVRLAGSSAGMQPGQAAQPNSAGTEPMPADPAAAGPSSDGAAAASPFQNPVLPP